MILPASMIATVFGILNTLYPEQYTLFQYWLLRGIAIWSIVQQVLTLYFMCRYYKIVLMKKEDILPLFTAALCMLIPGSTQVKIFSGIIMIIAAAGGSTFIAGGMLPCICSAMHGVTPPYCACVYTGMGIADAELKPTMKNCMRCIMACPLL